MAATKVGLVGAKVIFDENGPLYIFVGETEGFWGR